MTKIRITAACPEALMSDANHLAMALAFSLADGETYKNPSWQDSEGNLYAVASFPARPEWIAAAQSPLQRPAWDHGDGGDPPVYHIDMTAAAAAQAAMVFWTAEMGGSAPQAATDKLTVIGGPRGREALAMMGLTPVPVEEPI